MSVYLMIESLLLGAAAAWIARAALTAMPAHASRQFSLLQSEAAARFRHNRWYAIMEVGAQRLAQWNKFRLPGLLRSMRHDDRLTLPPAEAVATWQLQSLTVAGGVFLIMRLTGTGVGPSLFTGLTAALVLLVFRCRRSQLRSQSARRQIRARLPYVIELVALLLDTGGGMTLEAFRTAARDNRRHPIGKLLRDLISRVDDGAGLAEAVPEWAREFDDPDLSNVAVVIRTSEERGAPLHQTLRALAEQLRVRRLEQLEAAAEQASVYMTGPVFVVVVSCLIVAAAPLSLTAHEVLKDVLLPDSF